MEDIGGERERKVGHNPLIQDLYLKDIVEKKVSLMIRIKVIQHRT